MSSSAPPTEILCIGFGALGTIYSYLLTQGGASITAVARSNYNTLTTTGIHISSAKYGEIESYKPTRTIRESSPHEAHDRYYEFVVCTFKNVPDQKSASSVIRSFLKPGDKQKLPTIVLLQNGVGIEEEVQRNLVECSQPVAKGVISAVAWIGANLVDGGTKVVHGALERLEFGTYACSTSPMDDKGLRIPTSSEEAAIDKFARLYLGGGGGGRVVEDIEAIRWSKVLWNASWGGLSTLARSPVSALLTEDTLHYSVPVVRRIMLEILYTARACGISESRFPAASVDNTVTITLATADIAALKDNTRAGVLAKDFKPSILLDLENGRPMELEPIVGNVVRKAREHGVETPRLDVVLAALKVAQVDAVKRAKLSEGQQGDAAGQGVGVTKFSELRATSSGNWPSGAPVSTSAFRYL